MIADVLSSLVEYDNEKYLLNLSEYIKFGSKTRKVDLSIIEELERNKTKD